MVEVVNDLVGVVYCKLEVLKRGVIEVVRGAFTVVDFVVEIDVGAGFVVEVVVLVRDGFVDVENTLVVVEEDEDIITLRVGVVEVENAGAAGEEDVLDVVVISVTLRGIELCARVVDNVVVVCMLEEESGFEEVFTVTSFGVVVNTECSSGFSVPSAPLYEYSK